MPISPQITVTPDTITTKNFAISAVTYTSSTATYTATGHTFSTGDVVLITSLTPDGYNGTFTITATATNTFTVANTTNAAVTVATGDAFWASATDYDLAGYSAAYVANSDDLAALNASTSVLINGKTRAYYQGTAPSGTGLNEGDLWFDTSNGYKLYIYTSGAWSSVQDTAIAAASSAATAAAAAATAAQSTADGKNKVYRQGSTPSGTFAVGDLWFDTANDNKISRWDGSSWVANTLGNNALASISANKLNAGSIDASVITVSNINAGNISTGYLAAARIQAASLDATKIVSGSITATQIAAGTITATEISSSYIYAGTIAAGNITAGTVTAAVAFNAASGTFSGTITASAGTIGGWKLSSSSLYTGTVGSETQYLSSSGGGLLTGAYTISSVATVTTLTVGSTATVTSTLRTNGNIEAGTMSSGAYTAVVWNSSNGRFYTSSSSERFKTNIKPVASANYLSKLLQLEPVTFNYKAEFSDNPEKVNSGLIAERVAEIPEFETVVNFDKNGLPESIAYDRLSVFMIPALKDLNNRLLALEGK